MHEKSYRDRRWSERSPSLSPPSDGDRASSRDNKKGARNTSIMSNLTDNLHDSDISSGPEGPNPRMTSAYSSFYDFEGTSNHDFPSYAPPPAPDSPSRHAPLAAVLRDRKKNKDAPLRGPPRRSLKTRRGRAARGSTMTTDSNIPPSDTSDSSTPFQRSAMQRLRGVTIRGSNEHPPKPNIDRTKELRDSLKSSEGSIKVSRSSFGG